MTDHQPFHIHVLIDGIKLSDDQRAKFAAEEIEVVEDHTAAPLVLRNVRAHSGEHARHRVALILGIKPDPKTLIDYLRP